MSNLMKALIFPDTWQVELIDTAGLRDNPDRIEAEGIRRAREALKSADAVLWIQDSSDPDAGSLEAPLPDGVPTLVVRNKVDVSGEGAGERNGAVGLSALRARLGELAGYKNLGEGAFTARQRHVDALERAAAHFEAGCEQLETQRAGELLAEELRLAQEALGEITGAVSADDLLGRIFSEFCIGK